MCHLSPPDGVTFMWLLVYKGSALSSDFSLQSLPRDMYSIKKASSPPPPSSWPTLLSSPLPAQSLMMVGGENVGVAGKSKVVQSELFCRDTGMQLILSCCFNCTEKISRQTAENHRPLHLTVAYAIQTMNGEMKHSTRFHQLKQSYGTHVNSFGNTGWERRWKGEKNKGHRL